MSSRYALPVVFGAFVFAALVTFAAFLLLQACALPVSLLQKYVSSCRTPSEIVTTDNLQVSMATGLDLQRRIFELERELAAKQCIRAPIDPNAPLTTEGWNNRDLKMLLGCWNLDTTYRTRDVDSGEIRTYSEWQMCFDTQGNGTQVMRANDGTVCEGTVRAEFAGGGLSLVEPGNLACEGGGYIHQRQISCAAAAGGTASCDTLQPETNGKATVTFERAPA